jgi:ubiquinol-cytochrome c reductase cytochrome b subunit
VFFLIPSTVVNAWVGFFAAILFLGLFIALPFITKKEAKGDAQ